jgi:hypothetical protein
MLSAVSQTGGATTLNAFLGGQSDQIPATSFAGHPRDWRGPAAEIIGYTTAVSVTDRQKINSYLAIKYGTTLAQDYLSTSGSTIFTTAAPYNNNIIGIGRDDIEALTQKQSHNDDDIVRIYLSTITSTNALNAGSFTNNISYVVTGANTGAMCATVASNAEKPAACGLFSRIEREWKVTRTNMNQNFNMDFKLAACAAPGSVVLADLRLLVDDDGNFGNGGTTCYSNVTNPGLFTYSNPTITVNGITSAMIPNNSTRFLTIGSVQVITPLPIELLTFDAVLNQKRTVDLTWTTATEHNSDYFIAEKSLDLQNWVNVCLVQAAGNSSNELDYSCEDTNPFLGLNYYRLKEVDQDGSFKYSETRVVNLESTQDVTIYPNPTNSIFSIQVKDIESKEIQFFNSMGQEVELNIIASSSDLVQYDTNELSEGIYYVKVTTGLDSKTYKLIVLRNK